MSISEIPRAVHFWLATKLWLCDISGLAVMMVMSIWCSDVLGGMGIWILVGLFALRFALPRISRGLLGVPEAKSPQ